MYHHDIHPREHDPLEQILEIDAVSSHPNRQCTSPLGLPLPPLPRPNVDRGRSINRSKEMVPIPCANLNDGPPAFQRVCIIHLHQRPVLVAPSRKKYIIKYLAYVAVISVPAPHHHYHSVVLVEPLLVRYNFGALYVIFVCISSVT